MTATGPFPSIKAKVNPASFDIFNSPYAGATEAPHPLARARARARTHTHTRLIGHHWVSCCEVKVGRGFASFLYLVLLPSLLMLLHHSPWLRHTRIPWLAAARALPQLGPR